jgi:hypothetical protein
MLSIIYDHTDVLMYIWQKIQNNIDKYSFQPLILDAGFNFKLTNSKQLWQTYKSLCYILDIIKLLHCSDKVYWVSEDIVLMKCIESVKAERVPLRMESSKDWFPFPS